MGLFYHVLMGIPGVIGWVSRVNLDRLTVLKEVVCPWVAKDVVLSDGTLLDMGLIGYLSVIETSLPVDNEWPVKRSDLPAHANYDYALLKALPTSGTNVSSQLYAEAIRLIVNGDYISDKTKLLLEQSKSKAFFIGPLGNVEVMEAYDLVVKPVAGQFGWTIVSANELHHTEQVTSEILRAITESSLVVADLTDERPNCYYEVGFAHALKKPVLILAKAGTQRHFDIAGYRWNYWRDLKDLKATLEAELRAVRERTAFKPSPVSIQDYWQRDRNRWPAAAS